MKVILFVTIVASVLYCVTEAHKVKCEDKPCPLCPCPTIGCPCDRNGVAAYPPQPEKPKLPHGCKSCISPKCAAPTVPQCFAYLPCTADQADWGPNPYVPTKPTCPACHCPVYSCPCSINGVSYSAPQPAPPKLPKGCTKCLPTPCPLYRPACFAYLECTAEQAATYVPTNP